MFDFKKFIMNDQKGIVVINLVSMMMYVSVSPWTDFSKKCSLLVIVLVNSRYTK